ncbi:MAG: TetR/AcrR family transcriptional regulator [Elusimicrobia bacterium]|nr:TetR/AcrR family transcriptional regulator [Elusimicrobiota bacterium]
MHFIVEQSKVKTILPKVMRAAVRLFVEKGIDGTTTKDIASKSGVSEGALYRHFKSKEDLAYHIFATHVNEFSHELTALINRELPGRAQLGAFVATAFKTYEEERDLFTYLILSEHRELDKFPSTFKHPGHVVVDLIKDGQTAKAFRPMDPFIGGSLILGGIIRICVVRYRQAIGHDLRKETEPVTESLWRALKN